MIELTCQEDFENLLKNEKRPIILDFYASWCGPCKAISPHFVDLSEMYKNICFVKSGQTQSLLSADLLNPISKLGFEDINTWAWMHQDYVLWLESSKKSCNLV